ncbi:SpoIIE family protein phosphatase [Terracidiphilus sp.]|uniref:SpoIIE family protein phosphatase n=1 Tax=Terracidiphilus sp. TaxID=1964191 RepID=UPI003C1BE59B
MSLPLYAQAPVFDATRLRAPSQLHTQCLVHAGDDTAYADPGFDDSHWIPFDPSTSIQNIYGTRKPEIVWYRLRVKVDPAQADLALDEFGLARAFEIYANGERVMAVGRIAPYLPYTTGAHVLASIPGRLLASGTLVLALRVVISPAEWTDSGPGYDINNLTIGSEATIDQANWLGVVGENWLQGIVYVLYLALGIVALVLFSAQRTQTEYLWIAAVCALQVTEAPIFVLTPFINIPMYLQLWISVLRLSSPWMWGGLYFSFVGMKIGWRWRIYFILAGILNGFGGLADWIGGATAQYQLFTNLPFIILLSVIIPVVLARRWRKGNREAGILLIPAILFSLYIYCLLIGDTMVQLRSSRQAGLDLMRAVDGIHAGPFRISIGALSDIFSVIALGVIILLRSSRMSRRQAQLESEMEAAQQVQQVLVPERTASVPGFAVDAVYLPAQQVGGDFFQVLPAGDGGLLVVVGDVAGKGLPAAMLVSALVGSIRTAADDTHAPEVLLHRLNERLVGRTQGGFATALAAYIAPNGAMTIANAGHLPPYLDGKEIELPGALPLGIASPIHYETLTLQVPPGSRLTFYSDGVIEAQNPKGELFGFDRSREISTLQASRIAETARRFGQQDDITVVTIEREHLAASAA